MKKTQITLSTGISMLLFITLFYSCSTRSIPMKLLVPAEVTIPKDVQSIAILNHSLPAKQEQFINILEGFITGESILADREGSFQCIRGVEARLNESPRVKAFALETDAYRGTGTRQFPEFLDWETIDALCDQYKVDAILSLETFDSDFGIKKHTSEYKEKVNGREVKKTEYHADLRIDVNSGWRFYDRKNRNMIDQVSFSDRKEWSGSGKTEQGALNDLPSKRRAINESGRFAGFQMANRISPNWRTETRTYFVKGNEDLKAAKVQVKFNNWDEAINIWKKLSENKDPKIAGRACYNLALASEMKGNMDIAIVWAEKAMKVYHVKKARNYVDVLYTRKDNELRLDKQMNR
ncbi:MAG: hypothetical protein IPH84_17010 [Bacteroidales bacterium]|nr:hypothetical protein [Bacteroidales bacterium]